MATALQPHTVSAQLSGGLGNQLFQLFAAMSYALSINRRCIFLETSSLGSGSTIVRPTYWSSFFSRLRPFLGDSAKFTSMMCIGVREPGFTYTAIPLLVQASLSKLTGQQVASACAILQGYFQSPKYFEDNYPMISRILRLEQQKSAVLEKYADTEAGQLLRAPAAPPVVTVAMHFRRGDYKKIQHYHPLMTEKYYISALKYIRRRVGSFTIIYFCEDEDAEDVTKMVDDITDATGIRAIRAPTEAEDWEQLLLMSCATHNIIANSTFSWWGAYFNSNLEKIVCYPATWFGPSATANNTCDMFPSDWRRVTG